MLRAQLVGLAVVAHSSMRLGVATGVRSRQLTMVCSRAHNAVPSGSLETVHMFSTTISPSPPISVAFPPSFQLI